MQTAASSTGLKLPEISLGLWHTFGGTAPLDSKVNYPLILKMTIATT
jgi:hypothetical protein